MNYQQQLLAGMNGVELIVALYDGMIRFLYKAIQAIEANDVSARRAAIKRTFDILIHLQSRLRMDVGGSSAKALAEFYAAIFALCLEGSRLASADRLREAIGCIRDVRDAWRVAAQDPEVIKLLHARQSIPAMEVPSHAVLATGNEPAVTEWSA